MSDATPPPASETGPPTSPVSTSPEQYGDDRATREPIYGSTVGLFGLAVLLGGPVWLLLTVVLHARTVSAVAERLRAQGMLAPPGTMVGIDDPSLTDSLWPIAMDPGLLIWSGAQALVLTALALVVIGVGVFALRGAALALDSNLRGRSDQRYNALVGDGGVLSDEAWTRDLPEPDPEERSADSRLGDAPGLDGAPIADDAPSAGDATDAGDAPDTPDARTADGASDSDDAPPRRPPDGTL